MPEQFWSWFGDIHGVVESHWAGIIVTVAAVLCGGVIGVERGRAQKPAGMRTLILICLGAAIFTQASIMVGAGGAADRGRIAAQVVSGIGFLGAGAIIRERGLVIGVTTGAGIWATAAVGVVLGSGYVAAGVFFTLLIVATLAGAGAIDRLVLNPCRYKTLRISFDPGDGKTQFLIQGILDEHQHDVEVKFKEPVDGVQEALIRYCAFHRDHRAFLPALTSLRQITRIQEH
ncbi:MAG: MgtC/SapB family protein [Phycisphaerae bacterium]|nr:MgtC/SapB family protein [Phycisphaerae bacterium]